MKRGSPHTGSQSVKATTTGRKSRQRAKPKTSLKVQGKIQRIDKQIIKQAGVRHWFNKGTQRDNVAESSEQPQWSTYTRGRLIKHR